MKNASASSTVPDAAETCESTMLVPTNRGSWLTTGRRMVGRGEALWCASSSLRRLVACQCPGGLGERVLHAGRGGRADTHYGPGSFVNFRDDSVFVSPEAVPLHILLDLFVNRRHFALQLRYDNGLGAPLPILSLRRQPCQGQ